MSTNGCCRGLPAQVCFSRPYGCSDEPLSDDKLVKFLKLVPSANWKQPPSVWGEQLRRSLSEGFVSVGFGGILKLTDAGRSTIKAGE